MKRDYVANPVIGRLPRYYRCIEELYQDGCVRVSSKTLADRLGLKASQIRQDFSCFGEFGQQGYGYNVAKLRDEIRDILGINITNTAVMIGCGNLGHALLNNFAFSHCGFTVLAAFDVDPALIGTRVNDIPIYGASMLDEFLAQHHPEIAILTVPRSIVQDFADKLVQAGVKGLWNFTARDISVSDPDVVVENVIFQDSLLTLSYRINRK